ncbi:MAG: glycosyltransferase family 39 protein [Clostridia bacterium]|nr:glycosyltransferase family 39 protein [Clostridia bacterium]MBQ8893205.1 glycosyltransferase family 39 protein [Clostridia bacterium]
MKIMMNKVYSFIKEHKGILILMILLFLERVVAMYEFGIMYSLKNDDLSYVNSGITFAKTGMITMHDTVPSAQIMPGMTVLIGFLSLIFGEGKLFWLVMKLLWFFMASMTAWFTYRSVSLFTPKWCGILAAVFYFRPDYVWMDNVILTETPFLLALTAMIYFTFKMAKEPGYKNFWLCAIAYFCGLMLKANIAPYPLFVLVYLLIVKYDKKLLIKQCALLIGCVLCFLIPWSIRNYTHFNAFIPLTYGSGNPTLLGTYQGVRYPADEKLDYETNVEEVAREKYAEYYGEDGEVLPQYRRYVSLGKDAIKARYRQKYWAQTDWKSMVYSYFVRKPQDMLNSIFYWKMTFNIKGELLKEFPIWENLFCILTVLAALILKKYRYAVFYAAAVYLGNIYIYAMTYSYSRYNASLISAKYILIGIGISLVLQLFMKGIRAINTFETTQLAEKNAEEGNKSYD